MRFELQQLFDKGFPSLAYQLEAMMLKSPEISDDYDNLITLLDNAAEDFETKILDAYDNGHNDGYITAVWNTDEKIGDAFDDGRNEGYEEGYQDGFNEGMNNKAYID